MHRLFALALPLLLALAAPPAGADGDEGPRRLDFAGDTYVSGGTPPLPAGETTGSLFAAGETVRAFTAASGSVHLAGRRVEVRGPVGGNVYAAGYDVDVTAEVSGDATLAGRAVVVEAPVGGVLRVAAGEVTVTAPVGALLAAGERIYLDAPVAGDARIFAEEVEFGPNARIDGTLTLTVEEDSEPPAAVVPPERVERGVFDWEDRHAREGTFRIVLGVIASALIAFGAVVAMQAVFLGGAPRWSEDLAFDVAERPFRSFGAGFLAFAAVIGAIPLLLATLIGAPLAVVVIVAAPILLWIGYALGAWALGAAVWRAFDRAAPLTFWARLGIGLVGLVLAVLLGLIPFAGWIVTVIVTLIGLGAASAKVLAGRSL